MSTRVQFVSETHELFGTRRNAVIEHRRDRSNLAVQKELRATFFGDALMVAASKALE